MVVEVWEFRSALAALKGNLERQREKILAALWFVHARRMHANENDRLPQP